MIDFNKRIVNLFKERSKKNYVDTIHIGLGYTAVVLKNNSCGLCCTLINNKENCTVYKSKDDFEGECCYELLLTLNNNKDPISRAIVIAMVNALTQCDSKEFDGDKNTLFQDLKLCENDKLGMIGYFMPLVKQAREKGIIIKSYDIGKEIGNEDEFYKFVSEEASALIITATSFINNTFSTICERIKVFDKPVAILGPSTIMAKDLYLNTPVSILGGTLVTNKDGVLKAIRNGKGTPHIHKNAKKIYQLLK